MKITIELMNIFMNILKYLLGLQLLTKCNYWNTLDKKSKIYMGSFTCGMDKNAVRKPAYASTIMLVEVV